MTFAYHLPAWALACGVLGLFGLAVLTYWRARGVLGRARFGVLVGLRVLVLLLLAAVLLRPVRIEPGAESGGHVTVLLDVSASMSLTDEQGRSRLDAAREAVATQLLPALGTAYTSEVLGFGERVATVDLSSVQADARESRLDAALDEVARRSRQRTQAAVVVVSDGGVATSAEAASPGGAPVFAVAVGSDVPARDREVYGVTIGDPRVQGSLVDLTALVVAHAESASPANVTVQENGRTVDVRHVTLPGSGTPVRITARVAPAPDAPTVYTVSVDAVDDELTDRNNQQSVVAAPAGGPLRVLVVEGAPAFEHGFLKRALSEDAGLAVDAVVRKGANQEGDETFYVQAEASQAPQLTTGFPSTKAALFRYDAVVLANIEPASLSRDQLDQLQEFVGVRGGGLVLLGAKTFESRALVGTPLEDVAPVELQDRAGGLARASVSSREPLRVQVTDAATEHPVMRLGVAEDEARKAWAAAPALASVAPLGDPRPGATLLATTSVPGGVTRPLVAVQRYGRGRAVLFAGEASWRWKMMLPAGDRTYDSFWRQAVRWAAGDATGPVAVRAAASGRRVQGALEARDEVFTLARDAQTLVRIVGPSKDTHDAVVTPARGADALARAEFEANESGVYRVDVEARRGKSTLGSATAWALVGGVDNEFVNPRRDEAALRRIVEPSGGRVVSLASMSSIPAWIREASTRPESMVERDVWHAPWVFLLVLACLSVEWTLRRRWGLR